MSHLSFDFLQECDHAPRLTEMAAFFSATASGLSGVPRKRPVVDLRLVQQDQGMIDFISKHQTLWGRFDPHYFSSIPYRLEEEARLGHALFTYGLDRGSYSLPVGYYVLGSAEGTFARTLGTMANGVIRTLSCSPNDENRESFYLHGDPEFSSFFLGPFHRLDASYLLADPVLRQLYGKFDIILEDTTFQMYSPNRSAQIAFVKSHLKDDGIMLFIEKFRHPDPAEYARRELQKDYGYKARFFSSNEIDQKNETILKTMNLNEVTHEDMAQAIAQHFRYASLTWNSGNFYTVAASNSASNLQDLIGRMCEPCIPNEYVYSDLPQSMAGLAIDLPSFRKVVGP